MAIQEDILITKKFDTDASSPIKNLTKPTSISGYQFPSTIRDEQFYTIFRIGKREVEFERVEFTDIEGQTQTQNRRLKSSVGNKEAEIVLPLPPNLSTAYGATYTNSDLGVAGAAAASAIDVAKNTQGSLLDKATAGGKELLDISLGGVVDAFNRGDGLLSGAGGAISAFGEGLVKFAARSALNTPVGAGLGIANNPYEAIVYQNPEFRTHSFQYNLFARNYQESQTILNIIHQFKLAMHPEFDSSGLFFNYPRVVDIEYVVGTEYNPFIHKISTSALTSFSVNYHGDGTPSYFNTEDENPAPTNVSINMSFQELNFHTRQDIEAKYF